MWGMNVIGLIEPKASNEHRFIFVMIDYFTKWVEATSFPKVTREIITSFIINNIIYQYRQPEILVSDNDKKSEQQEDERIMRQVQYQAPQLSHLQAKDE